MKGSLLRSLGIMIAVMGLSGVPVGGYAQKADLSKATALEKQLYQAALREGKLEWWDSFDLKEATAFIKEFGRKYPGIQIDYFEATSDVREEKYLAEHAAGRKTMDLTTIDQFDLFDGKGLLMDMSDIIKDSRYPVKFATGNLRGVTLEHVLIGTAYNTRLVKPADVPRSWEDLLDKKWRGKKIGVESRFKLFIYNTPNWGEEKTILFLRQLREQVPVFTKGASRSMALLSAGEFPINVGMYVHGVLREQKKGGDVDWAPISPVIDKMSPYVIMRDAPHPNAAKLFLRWYMSPEGQLFGDNIRAKGNPVPGSNTVQSKLIEKIGVEIFPCPAWEVEAIKGLEDRYAEAIGFRK